MIPAEIPVEILLDVAKVIEQAEAKDWPVLGAENFTDETLIDGIAARVMALKARGWGQ